MFCTELQLRPENALSPVTVGHLDPNGECVCGVDAVVDRVLVGRGDHSREMDAARSPPGCLLVTMVAMAPLPGSGESIGWVSVGCSRGAACDAVVAQLLGRGPRLSPVSWNLRFLFVMSGV